MTSPSGAIPGGPGKGKVEAFDVEAGLGQVRAEGGRLYSFHCTDIAGGSRQIDVGAAVEFVVVPGHRGTWEARNVTPEPGK
ncbi:MAG: cold shock domain-containing protein [Acidimicrobiales bacterium]